MVLPVTSSDTRTTTAAPAVASTAGSEIVSQVAQATLGAASSQAGSLDQKTITVISSATSSESVATPGYDADVEESDSDKKAPASKLDAKTAEQVLKPIVTPAAKCCNKKKVIIGVTATAVAATGVAAAVLMRHPGCGIQ
jgi:hypothetical protein